MAIHVGPAKFDGSWLQGPGQNMAAQYVDGEIYLLVLYDEEGYEYIVAEAILNEFGYVQLHNLGDASKLGEDAEDAVAWYCLLSSIQPPRA